MAQGIDGYRVQVGGDHGVHDLRYGRGAADQVSVGQQDGALRVAKRVGRIRDECRYGAGHGVSPFPHPAAVRRRAEERFRKPLVAEPA